MAQRGVGVRRPWWRVPAVVSWAGTRGVIPLAAAAAAAALGLMLTLPTRVGMRLLMLLAIPAYPSLVSVAAGGYATTGQHELIYLPTLALLGLAAVRAWRVWQSRSPGRDRMRPG